MRDLATSIVADTWRAMLVVVVVVALRAPAATAPPAQPAPQPVYQPQWGPSVVYTPAPAAEPPRRIGRVGSAVVELAESVLGVFR